MNKTLEIAAQSLINKRWGDKVRKWERVAHRQVAFNFFIAGAEYQAAITREETIREVLDIIIEELEEQRTLRSDEPSGNNHLWSAYDGAVMTLEPIIEQLQEKLREGK